MSYKVRVFPVVCAGAAVLLSACTQTGTVPPMELAQPAAGAAGKEVITERHWKLVEVMGQPVSAGPKEPYILLKEDGHRLVGNGGCNGLGATYELKEPQRLAFTQIVSTMMACPNLATEQTMFKALEMTDSYTLNGNDLVLNRARMAPLARFKALD